MLFFGIFLFVLGRHRSDSPEIKNTGNTEVCLVLCGDLVADGLSPPPSRCHPRGGVVRKGSVGVMTTRVEQFSDTPATRPRPIRPRPCMVFLIHKRTEVRTIFNPFFVPD